MRYGKRIGQLFAVMALVVSSYMWSGELQAASIHFGAPPTYGMIAGAAALLLGFGVDMVLQGAPRYTLLIQELSSDGAYLVDNVFWDAEDIVTSPLHIFDQDSPLRSGQFYLALFGLGAVWSGSFGMDEYMKHHLDKMSSFDANQLEHISYGLLATSTSFLYGYGLYYQDTKAREMAITAGEGAGVATLLDVAIKDVFGRLRPRQTSSHTAFFAGGRSFVSGDVTPMFALAAGISEYFDNAWYIAAPVYATALTDGFGRMGRNAHWFSDVVGAAMLGTLTTELLIHLHKEHGEETNRFQLLPLTANDVNPMARNNSPMPAGLLLQYLF